MKITKSGLYSSQVERRKSKARKAKTIATSGEDLAAQYLLARAYKILARNFRAGRQGEIDIVALSPDEQIVFVEVKSRSVEGLEFGIPELGFDAVGYYKQRKILIASSAFMAGREHENRRWRYDVIVVTIPRIRELRPEIKHLESAFF